jgi:hypothetical protein
VGSAQPPVVVPVGLPKVKVLVVAALILVVCLAAGAAWLENGTLRAQVESQRKQLADGQKQRADLEDRLKLLQGENAKLAAVLVPALPEANEIINRTLCMSNLSSIKAGIMIYKGSHGNKWPANFMADLTADGQPATLFRCPSAKQGRKCDYFYLLPNNNEPNSIAVCDLAGNHFDLSGNHKGKRAVLYVGGNVRLLTEAEFQAELAKPGNAAFAAALRAAEGP